MKVGDLVKVSLSAEYDLVWVGQLGVIAEVNSFLPFGIGAIHRVLLIGGEEFWFKTKELELADESR